MKSTGINKLDIIIFSNLLRFGLSASVCLSWLNVPSWNENLHEWVLNTEVVNTQISDKRTANPSIALRSKRMHHLRKVRTAITDESIREYENDAKWKKIEADCSRSDPLLTVYSSGTSLRHANDGNCSLANQKQITWVKFVNRDNAAIDYLRVI